MQKSFTEESFQISRPALKLVLNQNQRDVIQEVLGFQLQGKEFKMSYDKFAERLYISKASLKNRLTELRKLDYLLFNDNSNFIVNIEKIDKDIQLAIQKAKKPRGKNIPKKIQEPTVIIATVISATTQVVKVIPTLDLDDEDPRGEYQDNEYTRALGMTPKNSKYIHNHDAVLELIDSDKMLKGILDSKKANGVSIDEKYTQGFLNDISNMPTYMEKYRAIISKWIV